LLVKQVRKKNSIMGHGKKKKGCGGVGGRTSPGKQKRSIRPEKIPKTGGNMYPESDSLGGDDYVKKTCAPGTPKKGMQANSLSKGEMYDPVQGEKI